MKHPTPARFGAAALAGALAACLLAAALTAALLGLWHSRRQMALLDGFCTALVDRAPAIAEDVYALVKEGGYAPGPGVLAARGYRPAPAPPAPLAAAAGAGFVLGGGLLAADRLWQRRRTDRALRRLTRTLEAARAGAPLPLAEDPEGEAGRLGDEIAKTVTELTRTRRAALEARDRFARDLADIAHQLKTPLTALSLAAQGADPALRSRMQPPLAQLERLGGALLLLARLDAGALPLHPEPADLFTLVQMAADGLQPLADRAGVRLEVPEAPPIPVTADPDWTVEALMNLMKNCIEHSPPGGAVHCTCADGALYAELCIRDEGAGFAPADLPRLFDRFYRGAGAAPGSTGIGLAIARELLQRQGAVLRAENHPEGGGVFRVRFYPGFPRP